VKFIRLVETTQPDKDNDGRLHISIYQIRRANGEEKRRQDLSMDHWWDDICAISHNRCVAADIIMHLKTFINQSSFSAMEGGIKKARLDSSAV